MHTKVSKTVRQREIKHRFNLYNTCNDTPINHILLQTANTPKLRDNLQNLIKGLAVIVAKGFGAALFNVTAADTDGGKSC